MFLFRNSLSGGPCILRAALYVYMCKAALLVKDSPLCQNSPSAVKGRLLAFLFYCQKSVALHILSFKKHY